jgi:hypothetical protein
MMSPEASDFAWIFVVKPPPKRPSAWPSCPFCSGRRHMRAHDGRIEHLNEMGGGVHRRERIEEGLEDAGLCSNGRSASLCCPGTETLRQSAPAHILDGEEMKRLEETPVVLSLLPRRARQARNTASVCAQSSSSIFVDIGPCP